MSPLGTNNRTYKPHMQFFVGMLHHRVCNFVSAWNVESKEVLREAVVVEQLR
uniref:Uncharacterized protein n=1 Tax=Arundo donax TaxID=35708 RepID=A0A0A9HJ72_ARUDO